FLHTKSEAGGEGVDSMFIEEIDKPEITFEKSLYIICNGDSIVLKPDIINPEFIYHWSDGFTLPERIIKKSSQLYLIAENKFGCIDSAYIQVEVIEMPTPKITTDKTEACLGENITLKAENINPEFDYFWSTGEKGESIVVSQSGKYTLKASNKNLCYDSTSIDIYIYPDLNLGLTTDKTTICLNDSTKIYPKVKYDKYLWSTGDTTETITVLNAGVYQLIVNNKIGCADTANIEIFQYNPKLISNIENLTYNELCLGSSETKNIKLTLQSDYDLAISNIYIKSNIFTISNLNSLLKTYEDGESLDISIIFKPTDAGEFFDTLVIESGEPCYYKKEIPIKGTSKALFQFSLPHIVAEAGDYLMIPINAGMTCPNSVQLNSDYKIEISFDKEYFMPDSVKYGNIIENKIVGQNRILKIKSVAEFHEKFDPLFPINYIYGMALVGRKELIPLTIDSVNFSNKRYYPEFINGSLKIEGCVINIRPIQMFNQTKLSITPNPSDGDIKISVETQEQGSFKIEIFNIQGQNIYSKEFTKSNLINEEFDYYFDTTEMGSGVYSVHLTSPWHIIRKQLVISK
ncbi:T9SS type A sorting domain-containing protein, partial [Dolichospermum sp. ST_sed3]|nr:T9SS type A sorting domain-containing protein [Dolichospermum sp. ST_sed3]